MLVFSKNHYELDYKVLTCTKLRFSFLDNVL